MKSFGYEQVTLCDGFWKSVRERNATVSLMNVYRRFAPVSYTHLDVYKRQTYQWLTMDQAVKHCTQGIGVWPWASNDAGEEPDLVMACCGDTPTIEALAATTILRDYMPELKIRFVNVVDLMKLDSHENHPHGLRDDAFDAIFTKDKPVLFVYHGYPKLIHELTYTRHNRNIKVFGYMEEGTITTGCLLYTSRCV